MKQIARILVHGGAFIFNTGAPYDEQLLFEYAERYARSEGTIELDFEGVTWTVQATGTALPCTRCGAHVDRLSYARRHLVLCAPCARTTRLIPPPQDGARAANRKPPQRKDGRPADRQRRHPPDAGM